MEEEVTHLKEELHKENDQSNLWQKSSKDIRNLEDYKRLAEKMGTDYRSYANGVKNFMSKKEQSYKRKVSSPQNVNLVQLGSSQPVRYHTLFIGNYFCC